MQKRLRKKHRRRCHRPRKTAYVPTPFQVFARRLVEDLAQGLGLSLKSLRKNKRSGRFHRRHPTIAVRPRPYHKLPRQQREIIENGGRQKPFLFHW